MHPRPSHHVAFGASASGSNISIGSTSLSPNDNNKINSGGGGFGFGFGYGQAGPSGLGASSAMAGVNREYKNSTTTMNTGTGIQNAAFSSKRRRRRSESSGDEMLDEDEKERMQEPREIASKRMRKDSRQERSLGMLQGTNGASSLSGGFHPDIDLGKALGKTVSHFQISIRTGRLIYMSLIAIASLSKSALLTVLTSLLTQNSSLEPLIISLLPAPSLDSFISTILINEKKIVDALPTGANLRDEYVWSRIRSPLEEYISEARLALGQFCPSISTYTGTSSIPIDDLHPTSTFTFLYTLTHSIRKLEVLLPRAPTAFGFQAVSRASGQQSPAPSINNPATLNPRDPLLSFLPGLFNQWHLLVSRLSTLVNDNGLVLSADMVRTWFRQLDTLINISSMPYMDPNTTASFGNEKPDSVGRRATEALRERFIKELGWLIGVRACQIPPSPVPLSQAFSQTQHLTSQGETALGQVIQGSAHLIDSKMMMDGDPDRSDEEL